MKMTMATTRTPMKTKLPGVSFRHQESTRHKQTCPVSRGRHMKRKLSYGDKKQVVMITQTPTQTASQTQKCDRMSTGFQEEM